MTDRESNKRIHALVFSRRVRDHHIAAAKLRVQINGQGEVYEMPPDKALQAAATVADQFADEADALREKLEAAERREKILVEALERYADVKRWKEYPKSFAMVVFQTQGLGYSIAAAALAKTRGEGEGDGEM